MTIKAISCIWAFGALMLIALAGEPKLSTPELTSPDEPHPATSLVASHWHILGPFEWSKQGRRFWGDRPLPPDGSFDLSLAYTGLKGEVRWQEVPEWNQDGGVHEVATKAGFKGVPGCVAAYLYRRVDAPADMDAILYLGFDDGLVLNLNGEVLLERFFYRHTEPRQEAVPIRLKKGRNDFLLKLVEKDNTQEASFCFEIRPAVTPPQHIQALQRWIAQHPEEATGVVDAKLRLMHLYRQVQELCLAEELAVEVRQDEKASPDQKSAAKAFARTRPPGLGEAQSCRVEEGKVFLATAKGTLYVSLWARHRAAAHLCTLRIRLAVSSVPPSTARRVWPAQRRSDPRCGREA